MPDQFYELLVLEKDRDIFFDQMQGSRLLVDLSRYSELQRVKNDNEFNLAQNPKRFFWISGEGSFFLLMKDTCLPLNDLLTL